MPSPTHNDIHAAIAELTSQFADFKREMTSEMRSMSERMGHPNDTKTGGTGMCGDLYTMRADVQGFVILKNQIVAVVAAATLMSAIIVLGLRQIIMNWLGVSNGG